MRDRRFIQADVFSTTPTKGNGLVVVVEAEGLTDAQMQECAIGLVSIQTGGAVPTFVAPHTRIEAMPEAERARIAKALHLRDADILRAARLTNGPVWHLLELTEADAVLAVDSAPVRWPDFVGVSLIGAHPKGAVFDYEIRNISPSSGMSEDPITGSLNAAIAHWLRDQGRLDRPLIMRRGTVIGREGRVHIQADAAEPARLLIGGHSSIVIDGIVRL